MSSNPLMMGYEGRDLLLSADWCCKANGQVAAQAFVCRLWAVAWLAGGSGQ